MPLTSSQLLRMSGEELDDLFRKSSTGELPSGQGSGTAIVFPGGSLARLIAWFARWFHWQGKVFDSSTATLVNSITLFRFKGIKAKFYTGDSWFDGQECIVLDYSKTSLVARCIRDEIREVSPNLYLGQVFVGKKRMIHFSVGFEESSDV